MRLNTVVGIDGRIHYPLIVKSLDPSLDENAIESLKSWRFEPATKDGKPVAVEMMLEIEFKLD